MAIDRDWLLATLTDALECLSDSIDRLEDERHDPEDVLMDDIANVYAKLNADGSIPDLYPGIKSEITEQGEAVFHLGKNLMYDRANDCFYAVGEVLESYFFTE